MGETCKVAKAMASALSSMADEAGGDVNGAAMDAHRSTLMFVSSMSAVRALATVGLRSRSLCALLTSPAHLRADWETAQFGRDVDELDCSIYEN